MTVGIMQPYFFPYIGYWQLMSCVDLFVIYDDVNYIKGGWINRNRILHNGKPRYFNITVHKASSYKKINETTINLNDEEIHRSLNLLCDAYKKAPYFYEVYRLVEEILHSRERIISNFLADSFRFLCLYLGIDTERILSSEIIKDNTLKGEDKVIHICRQLQADRYINAIGGKNLYVQEHFAEKGVSLLFLQSDDIRYTQFEWDFCRDLSIIDVLMFNSRENVKRMLTEYRLIGA